MGGRLATVHGTYRLGELCREPLDFGRTGTVPSTVSDLGLGYGFGRRFPSWTRHHGYYLGSSS
ncbi:UNVERIFIED_CONTAM: hypothetical protein Sradi_0693300 [Sesamum radiatum]|uniref:Uncharacterized protein n=1 Tax=Sesamum radiatum TaxID=300843 RepID=A0AAW2VN03_SESRA